jgi:hypothetical protein
MISAQIKAENLNVHKTDKSKRKSPVEQVEILLKREILVEGTNLFRPEHLANLDPELIFVSFFCQTVNFDDDANVEGRVKFRIVSLYKNIIN